MNREENALETMKLQIPSQAHYVATARLTVSSVANNAGFDIEAIEDIKVAVSEACTNILKHGGVGENYQYSITCTVDEKSLKVVVEDEGKGFNLGEYKEPDTFDAEKVTEGGLGIFIIRSLMDEVDVISNAGVGTSVTMTKYLPAAVEESN
jgi:serine/threonine-protein kinase RsbW